MENGIVAGPDGSLTYAGITVGGTALVDIVTGEERVLADSDEVVIGDETYTIAYLKCALIALAVSGEPVPEIVTTDYVATRYGMEGSSTLVRFFELFVMAEDRRAEHPSHIEVERKAPGLDLAEVQTLALLYEASFDRDGDIDLNGLNYWVDARENGLSETDVARYFLTSDEFARVNGDPDTLSNETFVQMLYTNTLDRAPDASGEAFWIAALDGGYDRASVLLDFAMSDENVAQSAYIETLGQSVKGDWAFFL